MPSFRFGVRRRGGSLPPIGFCPTGNTPLPPLRALKRRARNALAHTPPIPEPFARCTVTLLHLHCPSSNPTRSRAIRQLHRRPITPTLPQIIPHPFPSHLPATPPLDYHSYSSLYFYLKYSLRHRPWGFVDNPKIARIKSHSQTKRLWANCGRFVDTCG